MTMMAAYRQKPEARSTLGLLPKICVGLQLIKQTPEMMADLAQSVRDQIAMFTNISVTMMTETIRLSQAQMVV